MPGFVYGRRSVGTIQFCTDPNVPSGYQDTITTIVFASADGTETVLYDQGYNSTVRSNLCGQPLNTLRGKIFSAIDGSGMTFVSDEDIFDYPGADFYSIGANLFRPSGLLKMKDGTTYVIKNAYVTRIRDRNGNELKLTYAHDPPQVPGDVLLKVTDSMNREVNFEYGVNDGSYGTCDRIVFKGFNGAPRIIRITHTNLASALRPDFTLKTIPQLFPEMPNAAGSFNPSVTASVWLPDGVRRYSLLYNDYGEVAQVTLPTGAVIKYDYAAGLVGGYASGQVGDPYPPNVHFAVPPQVSIYRRLVERRTFPDGVNLELRTTYGRPESLEGFNPPSLGYIDEVNLDANDATLSKTRHYISGSPYIEIANHDPVNLFPFDFSGREIKTELLDPADTVLRRIENTWIRAASSEQIQETKTSLLDASPAIVSKQRFDYDQFDNRTIVDEYDFGSPAPGALRRRNKTTFVTEPSYTDALTSPFLRSLPQTQEVFDGSDLINAKSRTTFEYDVYTAGLMTRDKIIGHDNAYDESVIRRGNVTAITKWVLPSTQLTTRMNYDIAGNVTETIDPLNHTTSFTFEDKYGAPDGSLSDVAIPPELDSDQTYAVPTVVTNHLGHASVTQYDYYLSKPVDTKDANGTVLTIRYNDALDRPTAGELRPAENGALHSQTSFTYSFSPLSITTISDLTSANDNKLKTEALFDGYGRSIETRLYEPGGYITDSGTNYDGLGRVKRTYNPHRSVAESTDGYTEVTYDALSRARFVKTFTAGAQLTGTVETVYEANITTVIDQAGNQRRSVADALGRMIRIDEPDKVSGSLGTTASPVQSTSYLYDVLDNLRQITQGGQSRYFMYDSLSRLIRARNPEQDVNASITGTDPLTLNSQWSAAYIYDENENLLQEKDARCTIDYTYDALSRVKTRSYTGVTTPGVTYNYDTATRGVGLLASVVTSGVSTSAVISYDLRGQVTAYEQQMAGGSTYQMAYAYNKAGLLTQETYPSQKTVVTEYDDAGRIAGLKNGSSYYAGAAPTHADRLAYAPNGAVKGMKLGNGLWEKTAFNSRLQMSEMKLGTTANPSSVLELDYDYGSAVNNGNLLSQTISVPGLSQNLVQSYSYDKLNRLKEARENLGTDLGTLAWKQTFDHDRWGNRTSISNTGLPPQTAPLPDPSTNRLFGHTYDPAGNVQNDGVGNTFQYDGENRQTRHSNSQRTTDYIYDGDGHRLKKIGSSATTLFVYNVVGKLVAEYTTDEPLGSGISYLSTDHLGSTRVATKGDATQALLARYDYLPYGGELAAGTGTRTTGVGYSPSFDTMRQKFTQKERDDESGLDYFLARYYSARLGRFTGVDAGRVMPADPQNWNRYGYVQNNPLKFIDPNGNELYITGTDADYIVAELEKFSGYKLTRNATTGQVTIDTKVKRNRTGTSGNLARKLKEVVDDKNVNVTFKAQGEDPDMRIYIDNYGVRQLDTDDYRVIVRDSPIFAASSLGHLLDEYYKGETQPLLAIIKGDDYYRSHFAANAFDATVVSDFTGKKESPGLQAKPNPAKPNTVTFLYSSIMFDIVYKTDTSGRRTGAIERVTQRKLVR
jgi:RHS repeat-associated protein